MQNQERPPFLPVARLAIALWRYCTRKGLGHKGLKPRRYTPRNVKFERRGKIGVTKKGIWFPEEMF